MLELDEALSRFHLCADRYGPGFSNHGPMAAEALCRLGHAALMTGLVDIYAPRLPPCGAGTPIPEAAREAALGVPGRVDDWRASFEAELVTARWQDVLTRVLPGLVDGVFAAGGHGLLRTAHAVRALEEAETPVRLTELSWGLAVWSAGHQVLPGTPGRWAVAGTGPSAALAAIEPLPPGPRPTLLSESAAALAGASSFRAVIERFDPDALPFDAAISELCRAAAGLYLDHPNERIAYAHTVTVPSALRLVAPHLSEDDRGRALGRVLQAAAAVHAVTHGAAAPPVGQSGAAWGLPVEEGEVERVARSPAEIRYRAACSLEVHAIKLAEACLREDAISPDEGLRMAAADAAVRLDEGNRGRVT